MPIVEKNKRRAKSSRKVLIQTWGCQMNKYDSEKMAGILEKYDYSLTDNLESADVVLLNTCSIRAKAEQKVFSNLGRLKQYKAKNPNLVIGVGGCIGQINSKIIKRRAPHVDLVFGTLNIHRLPALIEAALKGNGTVSEIFSEAEQEVEDYLISRENNIQAWISIMHGCNNSCSYCVVPFTRGREVSRKCSDIIGEIEMLSERGYKEVTLLGQNVNSYGNDIDEDVTFPGLLEKISEIKGIERIRFVTSHPKDFSNELIEVIKNVDKVCEQIHLPAQSGSNKILSLMSRKYSSDDYMERINRLKASVPGVSLSTDIIVGFPGETEEDFEATLDLIKKIEFDSIFLFNYSPRPETVAAKLPDQVDEKVKQKRFDTLLDLQKGIGLSLNKRLEGKIVEILVEGKSKNDPETLTGRTGTNKVVNFTWRPGTAVKLNLNTSADDNEILQNDKGSQVSNAKQDDLTGKIIPVKIIRGGLHSLTGQVIN